MSVTLVTSQVTDGQAAELRSVGVHFMDAAGNVFLDGPNLYLLVSGRRTKRPTVVGMPRGIHSSATRLLFAMLTDPCLDGKEPGSALIAKPYRAIGSASGISPSTIGWVMADLVRQGFVITMEDGVRRLVDRKRLFERWVQSYADRLRPRLLIGRYRPARGDWWKAARLDECLWSGEVAAAIMTGGIKPGTATIFGASPSHSFVLDNGLQADPEGTVEFLKPFWASSFAPTGADNCAHPLLVYADLMSIDDERTREVARAIYERHLRTIIETA